MLLLNPPPRVGSMMWRWYFLSDSDRGAAACRFFAWCLSSNCGWRIGGIQDLSRRFELISRWWYRLNRTMSSKAKPKSRKQTQKKSTASSSASVSSASSNALSSGYLLTCDPPAKQLILHLNDTKIADKKFIIEDLDATHLLIKGEVRDEITRKVEEWMDEVSNRWNMTQCLEKTMHQHQRW